MVVVHGQALGQEEAILCRQSFLSHTHLIKIATILG